jgi:ElaB/YqjD/DUF883 family membrane-anchored ribosome-binding protein
MNTMNTIEHTQTDEAEGLSPTRASFTAPGEMRRFLDDVEELLGRIRYFDDVDLARLRDKVETSVRAARESTQDATRRVREVSVQAATSADKYAHERPWTVVGLAALAGLAIGASMGRR